MTPVTARENRCLRFRRAIMRCAPPVLATALLSAPGTLPAQPDDESFEHPEPVAVKDVVPPALLRSANYEIAPLARAEDNFYHFEITTDHGRYEVASRTMLRIRLHESATIEELSAKLGKPAPGLDRSPAGRRGVSSERVVDILADPISTATQLLGNLTHNLEETFNDPRDAEDDERARRGVVDLNPDPHKRSAAAQLGVDVYSSNPHLQALLDEIALARSAGKTASSISPIMRNVYAERPFGSGVFGQRMNSILKNSPSTELNELVGGKLARLGIPPELRIAFVTHPDFTPRSRLYYTAYLELLEGVGRLEWLVSAAITARTEADALAYVNYLRMLAFYQLNSGDLSEVITNTRYPALASTNGDGVLALPLDYLAWTKPVAAAAETLGEVRDDRELDRFVVLLAGAPTDRAFEELADRAVEIRSGYSF